MKIGAAGAKNDTPCFAANTAADSNGSVFDLFEDDAGLLKHELAGIREFDLSMSEFARSGYIEISNRSLTILDPKGFRRIADWR